MIFLRTITLAALVSLISIPASEAQAGGDLTAAQQRAMGVSENWQRRADVVTRGEDGKVVFLFGLSQPTIVCSPLRLCDLELQGGEQVLNVHVGDNVRWKFDGARSGPNGAVPHVLIKPVEAGLETSLVITTDRRAYHIHLRSSERQYMARIGFDYANDPGNVVAALNQSAPQHNAAPSGIPGFGSVDDLDFDYRIRGDSRFKPVRVFNDGVKTYIEMPSSFNQGEAPVLLVLGPGRKEALVNYRIRGNRYIVDQIFDRAILVAGVGRRQDRITLTRSNRNRQSSSLITDGLSERNGG